VIPAPDPTGDERLLTFEIAQSLYALPISGVVEVAEIEEGLAAIPTLAAEVGGVINFHGDALPVLHARALLGVDGAEPKTPMQIIVITDRASEQARLGLPVDEILGLVDGPRVRARDSDPVAERRSIDGRVAKILDPARLVAQAAGVIDGRFETAI
jgi:chemotaxis signal transduction protein